jgi:hypothetical protein
VVRLPAVIVVRVVGPRSSRRCSTTSSIAEGELRSHIHHLRSFNRVTRFHYQVVGVVGPRSSRRCSTTSSIAEGSWGRVVEG